MKKVFSTVISFAVLLSVLAAPVVVKAVSTTSSLQELISSFEAQITKLKAQIAEFNTQLEALKNAGSAVKETTKEITGTLQIIKNLKVGMSGDDIKTLQEFLATDHDVYPEGLITGYFGKLTEKAVKKLQKKLCLEEVGSIGPKTMWRINELLQEGAGHSDKIPQGLLTAPGIQKKLCATSTSATTTLTITNVTAIGTGATKTQIRWFTNALANSRVWYGTATPVVTATPTASVSSSDYVFNHVIKLSGLATSTTYYYIVASTDKSGNATTSAEKLFKTLDQETNQENDHQGED